MKGFSAWVHLSILSAFFLAGCGAWPLALPTPTQTKTPAPTPKPPPSPTRQVYQSPTLWPTRTPVPTKAFTPTPPPLPPFTGRLLLDMENELYWLTGEGGAATLSEPLVSQLRQTSVSPDGRYLVYSGLKESITLMDLASGKKRVVASAPASCASWSPQSTRFTYKVNKPSPAIYMYDLASKSSVRITDFPCSSYMGSGLGGATGGGVGTGTFCGEVTCGVWMDESHLFFQHFTGKMPEKITRTGGVPVELQAQHTTMVTFGKAAGQRPKLEDWPERLYEVERCNTGPYVLLRKDVDGERPLFISPVFTDTAGVDLRPVPRCKYASDCSAPYFADAQCNLLTSHTETMKSGKDYVTLTDPLTLGQVFTSTMLPTEYLNKDGRSVHALWNWYGKDVWVGDPQERIIAMAVSGPKNSQIILLDLHTGGTFVLADREEINSEVLVWLAP